MAERTLFLDTSAFIQVGLLDENLEWISYQLIKNKKGSQVLHGLIFDLLVDQKLSIKDIKRLIVANGPGSYTGIRLAEGFAQILELEEVEIINFYHFEVPYFLGSSEYSYLASAFKGEYFCYSMKDGQEEKKLISQEQFSSIEESNQIFHIGEEVGGRTFNSLYPKFENMSVRIFSEVISRKMRYEPFYFRPLEKEFKPSKLIPSI